jgi:hypothetical protein
VKAAPTIEMIGNVPLVIGEPFEGGYFMGSIITAGKTYALIVAPKAEGETTLPWKKGWSATPGTLSLNDGLANSEAMNNDEHPAAQWCRSLKIGGKDDWCLPSRDDLELMYRNGKPTTDENYVYANRAKAWGVKPGDYNGVDESGNGHNASSVPAGDAYTKQVPAQTTAPAFRDGEPEAFDARWYWSSTEFGSVGAWYQHFGDGFQDNDFKYLEGRCRAVRKVLI